ncbi:geminin [Acanthochromis polyacanthus]|uniref:Geminin DNA replication inhibitor n=1 Tax=Acanthochromis polyacanthus TaxID=80966 RepID=A0A3Q1HVQ7_9TELE|nr:geminin [Acanthochromis polyacanthus]
MSLAGKVNRSQQMSKENTVSLFTSSQKTMGPPRQSLQILQQSAVNKDLGRSAKTGKLNSKRKNWTAEQTRGTKRVKVEVKSTQTEAADCLPDGISHEAYELMVKETPPPAYWKEMAEERQKALYKVLQENEKLHKDIEAKDEQISKLQSENEELQELAQHVQYMADMIERLTGRGPDNLEELKELALDVGRVEDNEHEDDDSEEADERLKEESDYSESDADEENTSDHEQAGPSGQQD